MLYLPKWKWTICCCNPIFESTNLYLSIKKIFIRMIDIYIDKPLAVYYFKNGQFAAAVIFFLIQI